MSSLWSTKSGEEDRDAERWMGAEATIFEAPNSIQANNENREFPPEPYDLAISKALASYRYKIDLLARGAADAACYGGTKGVLTGEKIPIHPSVLRDSEVLDRCPEPWYSEMHSERLKQTFDGKTAFKIIMPSRNAHVTLPRGVTRPA